MAIAKCKNSLEALVVSYNFISVWGFRFKVKPNQWYWGHEAPQYPPKVDTPVWSL